MPSYNLVESFDSYADVGSATIGVLSKWITLFDFSTSGGVSLAAGRYGGQCLRIFESDPDVPSAYRPAGIDSLDFAAQFSYKIDANGNDVIVPQIAWGPAGNAVHIGLRFTQAGAVEVYRGSTFASLAGSTAPGTLIGASAPGVAPAGQWHSCHVRAEVHDSTGFVHVAIDGPQNVVCSLTGVDTQNGAIGNITSVRVGLASHVDCGFNLDDLLMNDDGSAMLPERKIQAQQPTGDGSNLDFTPSTGTDHFAVVDGLVADSTDYLSASLVGEYDLLTVADLPTVPAEIDCVHVVGYIAKTDSTTRAMNLGIESNAVAAPGDDHFLTTSIQKYEQLFPLNPDGSVAWTYAAINALQLRPEVAV